MQTYKTNHVTNTTHNDEAIMSKNDENGEKQFENLKNRWQIYASISIPSNYSFQLINLIHLSVRSVYQKLSRFTSIMRDIGIWEDNEHLNFNKLK